MGSAIKADKWSSDPKDNLKGIKICIIATVPFYMVSQLKAQAEYMRDMGIIVVLVSSDGPELSKLELGCGLSHEIVEIPRSINLRKDFTALIRLIRVFRNHEFDIVHSTTPKAGLLSAIASFLVQVPVRLHTWTGQPWVTLKGPMRKVLQLADKIIGRLNTHCYADSESQRQLLVNSGIIPFGKIDVIGHGSLAGVDLDRFDPGRWSMPLKQRIKQELLIGPDSKVIVFVGRITREKGIGELISAFCQLLDLNYDVHLLLVGPLDQDRGGTGSIQLSDIKKYPKISYIGYTELPEQYMAIADIFCLPSYREGFGTTVIETAAMEVPTVGTKINGLIDAIVEGETGILVPSHDDKALLVGLRQLLDDPDLAYQMGIKARQRCIQKFDKNTINKKLLEEYIRILKKAPKE
jgi:glycosyltransferase involved in cell wall biosynthesis